MLARFDLEPATREREAMLIDRLRARIARRPGRWRKRMRGGERRRRRASQEYESQAA